MFEINHLYSLSIFQLGRRIKGERKKEKGGKEVGNWEDKVEEIEW